VAVRMNDPVWFLLAYPGELATLIGFDRSEWDMPGIDQKDFAHIL